MTNVWLHFYRGPKISLNVRSPRHMWLWLTSYFMESTFHLDRHFPVKVGKEDLGMSPQGMSR